MPQPAKVPSGNPQGNKKESGGKDRQKKKGKEKKANEKEGTYGLTKAEKLQIVNLAPTNIIELYVVSTPACHGPHAC